MKKIDNKKVAIVGCGMVGMSYAYALLNTNICNELILIDVNEDKAIGEAIDLNHGLCFSSSHMKIRAGSYEDCANADLVVITASAGSRKPGETRFDQLNKNVKIFQSFMPRVISSGFNGVFLVASNPVDVMTQVVYELSGFPSGRVLGSGTSLDTARLRNSMSKYFKINPRNVHAYVIGEHGDSEFVPWSQAGISVKSLDEISEDDKDIFDDMQKISLDVRDSAYEIIKAKGATYYAIGMVLSRLTRAILYDENSIFTVSSYLKGEYGEKGLYVGVPSIVNRNGVRQVVEIGLTDEEGELFHRSCDIIRQMIKEIEL